MDWLHQNLVAAKQKAVVSGVVGFVLWLCAKHGINLDSVTLHQALQALVAAVVAYISVFYKRNQ